MGEDGRLVEDRVNARQAGNFILAQRDSVQYVDVSPKQLVSVAASLIPFLEHDDANRALMGSNMQRQAVPLLRARAPFVGTGMEYITARDSGACAVARRSGTVDYVDSQRIVVRVAGEDDAVSREMGADIYPMTKFKRSNQNTCINQKPIIRVGQKVEKGQVLADGPCTELGELALGRNVLVAFMPWRGYNFEDAILVSERMVKDDYYTSIHIEEFEIESRDTKLGPEEITRDIPNVSETFLRDLDESGIIRLGASVKAGDILVGKVTPKGETQLTPEEKLLRAIFGEKAGDVRDASLICPPGVEGIVVGVKIFSRKGIEKDDRAKAIEAEELEMMEKNLQDEVRILHDEMKKRATQILLGQTLRSDLYDDDGREKLLKKGAALTADVLAALPYAAVSRIRVAGDDPRLESDLRDLDERTKRQVEVVGQLFEEKKEKVRRGDELPPGVIKLVKVYVAMKRKLSVGDKMAGRHGNKGVIARILPEEDMPYMPDGTPVEIVLNPLGVPSRMNVGQILETHLGWAARALGLYFATPVFDGATESEIKNWLGRAGLAASGQDAAGRRHDGRGVRAGRDGGLHLHAQAVAPGRRQDPRPVDRAVLAHHAAAAGRQGAVRRPALRRDGGLGARGVRRRAHPPGTAHREVGRRDRPREGVRVDRQGRRVVHGGPARIVQRAHPRAPVALPGRGAAQDQEEAAAAGGDRASGRAGVAGSLDAHETKLRREGLVDARFRRHPDQPGVAGQDPVVVPRRGDQAGDHQLPDLQARA